jgi:hypothetical protein
MRKKLELQRKLPSKPGGNWRNRRKLQKFPVIFPVLRETFRVLGEKEQKPYDAGLNLDRPGRVRGYDIRAGT